MRKSLESLAQLPLGTIAAQWRPAPAIAENLRAYASASGDSNPLHLDLEFARQAGFDDLVVHGMFGMAQLGRLLFENFEPACLRAFSVRFEGVVTAGTPLNHCARVAAIDGDTVRLELLSETGDGRRVISGEATLART